MLKKQRGFTLFELIKVVTIIAIIGLVIAFFKGNFWYTENGVLQALQFKNSKVEKVLKTTRNLLDYSEIVVQEDGQRKTYYLDTGIMWNYEFPASQDD